MGSNVRWTDLDVDGRRLERVIKFCETRLTQCDKDKNNDLVLAYLDRLIKATATKVQLTDMIMGIKVLRRLAEKEYIHELTHEKLIKLK